MTDEKPGELLFEVLVGHDRWRCELRDFRRHGIEAQFFKNGEFHHSHRWPTRDIAIAWAKGEGQDIEAGR